MALGPCLGALLFVGCADPVAAAVDEEATAHLSDADEAVGSETLSLGYAFGAAIKEDGSLVSWQRASSPFKLELPEGKFRSISLGLDRQACGIKTDGSAVCVDFGKTAALPGALHSLRVSERADPPICALKSDNTIQCFVETDRGGANGLNYYPTGLGYDFIPRGAFRSIDAGYKHWCGVKTDGSVACWGDNTYGQSTPPKASFRSVSAGEDCSCGVKTDGTIGCWGSGVSNRDQPPTSGTFRSVSTASNFSCGVKTDGALSCWENRTYRERKAPTGTFRSVTVGHSGLCGVKSDGSLICEGSDSNVPTGTFM